MAVVPQMPSEVDIEGMKNTLRLKSISQGDKQELAQDTVKAMYALANDLIYPSDASGDVIDIRYFSPLIAYHLAMCGWRKDPEKVQRVREKLPPTAGVAEDAIRWVDPGHAKQGELPLAFRTDIEEKPNEEGWHVKPFVRQTFLEEGEY
jgi:hypothetical protein